MKSDASLAETLTLDQLHTLIAVVEEGSFSSAGRRLKRVQSAISSSMAALEARLEVSVFDRSGKTPRLTKVGEAIVASARRVLGEVDELRRLSSGLRDGIEPSVSLCVDAFFPTPALIEVAKGFAIAFPLVDLRLDTQVMSAVTRRVLDGSATLGVVSPLGLVDALVRSPLATVHMIPVVHRDHPLASWKKDIPRNVLAKSVQIVLSERSDTSAGDPGVADQGVVALRSWRVADLHTKHALLRAGLGFGNLPLHLVAEDLAAGMLVRIRPEGWTEDEHVLRLSAIRRTDAPFGPAHTWMLAELHRLCRLHTEVALPASRPASRARR